MAMGRRTRDRQPTMWVAATELPTAAASHPFYARLNRMLADQGFDEFVGQACEGFYADGRPGLAPGIYFRLPLSALRKHQFGARCRLACGGLADAAGLLG